MSGRRDTDFYQFYKFLRGSARLCVGRGLLPEWDVGRGLSRFLGWVLGAWLCAWGINDWDELGVMLPLGRMTRHRCLGFSLVCGGVIGRDAFV